MATCANPGCDQPGTHKCSACKTKPYCGPKCQTADWPHHKEECPGPLRKVGMAHLEKAKGFDRQRNWQQTLHHADIAATKLKQLKDRPIEGVDNALSIKCNSLGLMGHYKKALECAKERYCLYLTSHTHPPAIEASFCLIQCCIHNNEFFDAALYARTTWETITLSRDSHIPDNKRERFTARGAYELARATLALAQHGGMPAEEKQEAGREAIMLARKALEIDTQLFGADHAQVADDMLVLADLLRYFIDVDDEVLRLYEQAKAIFVRMQGRLSLNVAVCEMNLGVASFDRANTAYAAHDLDQYVALLQLALTRYREALRIYRAINHVDSADQMARYIDEVEQALQQTLAEKAASTRG